MREIDQRSNIKCCLFGLIGILSVSFFVLPEAYALDLTAPFVLETAQVLPPNVRNPRFFDVFMSMDSKFDGGGNSQGLGLPLYKPVRWSDILDIQKPGTDKKLILATMKDAGVSADSLAGTTTGTVNTFFDVKVPVFAVGITERIMVAVAVPIMNIAINADTGFNRTANGQNWVQQVSARSVEQGNTAATKLNNSVNEKLIAYGYEPIQSKTISGVGDIQVVGKYLVYDSPSDHISLKSTISLPTGIGPNADLALDIPTGDARFELGGMIAYDRTLPASFKLNTYAGVTALMPYSVVRRIPTNYDDPISRDKEQLTQNLGESFALGTSLLYEFESLGIQLGAGYNFQFLTQPSYSRGIYTEERYRFLEAWTPVEALHTATLMAGFSTVEWYQKKKFVYPFQVNIAFSSPIIGRNVTTNNVLAGQIVAFF
jgi:hypothetical protein